MVCDKLGNEIEEGQVVLKVRENGVNAIIDFRTVLRVQNDKVYLTGLTNHERETPIRFPERLIIWPEGNNES